MVVYVKQSTNFMKQNNKILSGIKKIALAMLLAFLGPVIFSTATNQIMTISGTISIAGSMKEKPEIHVAENPNPLNPLIIDATNTVNTAKQISIKLS